MKKDLAYYMKLPYPIVIQPLVEEMDGMGGYDAWCPNLGRLSCRSWGETIPEALVMLDWVKKGIFERCLAEDLFIPMPTIIAKIISEVEE